MSNKLTKCITIRNFPAGLWRSVKAAAAELGVPVSGLVSTALRYYLVEVVRPEIREHYEKTEKNDGKHVCNGPANS